CRLVARILPRPRLGGHARNQKRGACRLAGAPWSVRPRDGMGYFLRFRIETGTGAKAMTAATSPTSIRRASNMPLPGADEPVDSVMSVGGPVTLWVSACGGGATKTRLVSETGVVSSESIV